jgi:hypothetical protein
MEAACEAVSPLIRQTPRDRLEQPLNPRFCRSSSSKLLVYQQLSVRWPWGTTTYNAVNFSMGLGNVDRGQGFTAYLAVPSVFLCPSDGEHDGGKRPWLGPFNGTYPNPMGQATPWDPRSILPLARLCRLSPSTAIT